MEHIEIKKEEQIEGGWRFLIEAGEGDDSIEYLVDVDNEHWEKLTDSRHVPEELVRRSFEFLLKREPKESILKQFNLRQISTYFPEYEDEMKEQMP